MSIEVKTLPYRPGTPLSEILKDGWSRQFNPSQTVQEAGVMGFPITEDLVKIVWAHHDRQMEAAMGNETPAQTLERIQTMLVNITNTPRPQTYDTWYEVRKSLAHELLAAMAPQ